VAITAGDHLSEKPRIVQLLIDRGARLTCSCHGRSPLQWAITNSAHLELCKVFLNNGAASETFDIG
jgi:ankyrin repeat protein